MRLGCMAARFRNAQGIASANATSYRKPNAQRQTPMFALLLPLSVTLMPTSSYHAVRGAAAARRTARAPAVVALVPHIESGGTAIGAAAAYFGYVAVIKAVSGSGAPDEHAQEEPEKTPTLQLTLRQRVAANRGLGYSDAQHEPARASAPHMVASGADDPDATRSTDEPVASPTKLMPIEYGRVMKGGFEPYLYNFRGEKR